jgi:hypothetical protein
MKTTILVPAALLLCGLLVEGAMSNPSVPEPHSVPSAGEGERDAAALCWSEPPSLGDYKLSSEIIWSYGIDSEVANDFVL